MVNSKLLLILAPTGPHSELKIKPAHSNKASSIVLLFSQFYLSFQHCIFYIKFGDFYKRLRRPLNGE